LREGWFVLLLFFPFKCRLLALCLDLGLFGTFVDEFRLAGWEKQPRQKSLTLLSVLAGPAGDRREETTAASPAAGRGAAGSAAASSAAARGRRPAHGDDGCDVYVDRATVHGAADLARVGRVDVRCNVRRVDGRARKRGRGSALSIPGSWVVSEPAGRSEPDGVPETRALSRSVPRQLTLLGLSHALTRVRRHAALFALDASLFLPVRHGFAGNKHEDY